MPQERLFEETIKEAAGYITNQERGVSIPKARIAEVADLIYNGVYRGETVAPHKREFLIREALTTADFPLLFGDVLDRQVLANYKAVDPVWKKFTRMSTNRDFKVSDRYAITGGDQQLARVAEKGEYLASNRTEAVFHLSLLKYGRQFDISWETLVNDDLGALKDTPNRFAMAAVRTEHRVLDTLWVHDTAGNHAAGNLYSAVAGEVNLAVGLLTIANLEIGVSAMAAFRDANGEPIQNRAKYLVVPPALEYTGRQILTSATKVWSDNAAGPAAYPTNNVIAQQGLELIVDPYLPIIDLEKNPGLGATGNTGWYLFADPKDIAAVEAAHMQGHERPELCMKASDKVTIGGGPINALSGDFATDNVFYRVRLVFGATKLDWRASYMGGHTD